MTVGTETENREQQREERTENRETKHNSDTNIMAKETGRRYI